MKGILNKLHHLYKKLAGRVIRGKTKNRNVYIYAMQISLASG